MGALGTVRGVKVRCGLSLPSTAVNGFAGVESGEVELSPCLRPLAQTALASASYQPLPRGNNLCKCQLLYNREPTHLYSGYGVNRQLPRQDLHLQV